MKQKTRYSKEIRDRGIRMVLDQTDSHGSQWAAVISIAPKIGCSPQSLNKWVNQYAVDSGTRPGQSSNDKDRIKDLERENKELRQANEILRKASAFFAQAELDRKPKR